MQVTYGSDTRWDPPLQEGCAKCSSEAGGTHTRAHACVSVQRSMPPYGESYGSFPFSPVHPAHLRSAMFLNSSAPHSVISSRGRLQCCCCPISASMVGSLTLNL